MDLGHQASRTARKQSFLDYPVCGSLLWQHLAILLSFPNGSAGDIGDRGSLLGWEDSVEKETAPHFSIFAWDIPWRAEPCGLQSKGLQSQTRLMTKHSKLHTHGQKPEGGPSCESVKASSRIFFPY